MRRPSHRPRTRRLVGTQTVPPPDFFTLHLVAGTLGRTAEEPERGARSAMENRDGRSASRIGTTNARELLRLVDREDATRKSA